MTYRPVRALGAAVLLAGCATTDSLGPSLYGKLGDGDVERAAATLQASLETARDGERRGWWNPATGHARLGGRWSPTSASRVSLCRRYEETLALGAG